MKQTQKEISPPSRATKIIKRGLIASLLVIVAGTLFYFLVQRPLEIRMNRADFQRAAAIKNDAVSKIIESAGTPSRRSLSESCSYASRAYGKGPRACRLSETLYYENATEDFANKSLVTLKNIFNTALYGNFGNTFDDSVTFDKNQTADGFSQDIKTIGDISCSTTYIFGPQQKGIVEEKRIKGFQINISCGGPAKAEFYPVVE